MSLEIYCDHFKTAFATTMRGRTMIVVLCFLDVNGCLNAVFRGMLGYGKSPCFSGFAVLKVFSVDWIVLFLRGVDGGFFLG